MGQVGLVSNPRGNVADVIVGALVRVAPTLADLSFFSIL